MLRLVAAMVFAALVAAAAALALLDGGDETVSAAARAGRGGGIEIDQRWPTAAELRWLDRYARWEPVLYTSAERALSAVEARERTAARRASMPFAECARDLPMEPPPSRRLALFARHVRSTCAAMERAVEVATTRGAYGTGSRRRRIDFELDQAGRALTAAHGMLPLGARRRLPVRGGRTGISRVEPRFSRAAGEVAEVESGLEVRCWSPSDWKRLISQSIRLGHGGGDVVGFVVGPGGSRIHLSPVVCAALVGTVYDEPRGGQGDLRAGESLLALAHEAQHAAGIANEAKATCYALQTVTELAYALDLRKPLIERLVERYWRHADELPAEYRSKDCRAGGKLDLAPNDDAWP